MCVISKLFDAINPLKQGLDASWLRDSVIRNNLANAETQGFERSSVAFETLYESALEAAGSGGAADRRTREGHRVIGGDKPSADSVQARVIRDQDTTMRMDGSNIDVEKENADLARNYMYYQSLLTKINAEFSQLRAAIKEGR